MREGACSTGVVVETQNAKPGSPSLSTPKSTNALESVGDAGRLPGGWINTDNLNAKRSICGAGVMGCHLPRTPRELQGAPGASGEYLERPLPAGKQLRMRSSLMLVVASKASMAKAYRWTVPINRTPPNPFPLAFGEELPNAAPWEGGFLVGEDGEAIWVFYPAAAELVEVGKLGADYRALVSLIETMRG